jgi:hypothetical protein
MSFANLKKNSQSGIEHLQKEMEKQGGKEGYQKDERFWSLERDKSGNGMAVIRFLPAPNGEDIPMVRVFSHGFQGKGGWFIENCPTTLGGRKCPVCEANNELWNSGIEDNKKIARDRKRKLSYISNILVVSDPSNRENEGKVFLYKYGKKIFDKLQEAMNPSDPDEPKFNPFDLWQGANFKLKAHLDAGYVSYDKSGFSAPTPLFEGDDAKLEALWKKEHSLKEFVADDQFKSYEELSTRFSQVMKTSSAAAVKAEDAQPEDFRSKMGKSASSMLANELPSKPSKAPPKKVAEEESEDDAISYFRKLAEDDE